MPEELIELLAGPDQERLDRFLAGQVPDLSRSAAQRLIDEGRVTVNGEPARSSYKVRAGDQVVVLLPGDDGVQELRPEAIPLHVVYEDDALLVVDKPAGMVVHPAPGHTGGTLANALLAHSPALAGLDLPSSEQRPGIVHRLDRDTSGLILLAKTEKVQRALQQQFKDRRVDKAYLALVHGHLQPAWGRIEAPIGRDPQHRQRMAVLPGGREAVTEYHVLEQFAWQTGPAAGMYSLVKAEPRTGRTHQIRVHLASVGHAVVGDPVYGRRRTHLPLERQFLHAGHLGFQHPVTGQRLELDTPLPADLAGVLELLREG
ncbi:MAG: RluA family pseudouridine synthase [Anaerolineae bacterium]|jgi:23S rRNA pseudouridine1911/1915/1917 synthase|nr:RluA family pseudouridine synthase [Anaerolineae bacterium]